VQTLTKISFRRRPLNPHNFTALISAHILPSYFGKKEQLIFPPATSRLFGYPGTAKKIIKLDE